MSATAIHADEYLSFCEGLRVLCGIDLAQYKRGQMERRLRSYFEHKGIRNLTEALRLVRAERSQVDELLDKMTINVSQLWRNPEVWSALSERALPELGRRGQLQAWSAGCSYGAEAFTLAALCAHLLPRTRVRIVGTDIDPRIVSRAREGRFSREDARSAPPALLARYFEAGEHGYRAKPELSGTVSFEVGDLLRMPVPRERYDLVLCRNTVIYFTAEVTAALHGRLVTSLRPGGYLVIGSTERVEDPHGLGLDPQGSFILRKR